MICWVFLTQMVAFQFISRQCVSRAVSCHLCDICIIKSSKRLLSSPPLSSNLHKHMSCLLERLDHRDWLAPNEVLKIFKGLTGADQVIPAFKKVSSRNDYKPNEALFILIIDKLAYARRFDDIEDLVQRLKNEKCRLSDVFFYKLIKIYVHVENHPERAIEMLSRMPEYHCWPTIKIFNLILNMLVCNKHYEIIHEVYLSASRLGIAVDTCCFNILIKGLCNCGQLDAAFSLLQEIPKQGCKPNVTTYSTLMHSLRKHDRVDEAIELCEKMQGEGVHPDTVSFNILISGLCKQGRLAEGMEFLKKMKLKGCNPNSGTYQALLYGLLSFKRFVDAKGFMTQMISERASPSFLSYKLLIYGLCNAGLLNDVEFVLRQMTGQGFIPQMGMWKKILVHMLLKIPESELESCTRSAS